MNMRRNLFRHIQKLSINYFDNTNTGELMSRVKDDIDNIWSAVGFIGMLILEVIFHTVIVIYCMLHISVKLAVMPLIMMPFVALLAILMEKKLDKVYEEISVENGKLITV